jgi:hypothetical protein
MDSDAPGPRRKKLKKPTTKEIDRFLRFNKPRTKSLMSEHIRPMIRMYHISGIKSERAWDLMHDILFLDPVTTRHFGQFQRMWLQRHDRDSPSLPWWRAFKAYMGHMFDKTRDQLNNWRWDNPQAFGDVVDRSNPQYTKSGKIKRTGARFKWYGSSDFAAKMEPPTCREHDPADFVALAPIVSGASEAGQGAGYGPGNPHINVAKSPLAVEDAVEEGEPDEDSEEESTGSTDTE